MFDKIHILHITSCKSPARLLFHPVRLMAFEHPSLQLLSRLWFDLLFLVSEGDFQERESAAVEQRWKWVFHKPEQLEHLVGG